VRYNDLSERAVTDARRRHDQYTHLASCCEYYAIYYRYRFVDPLDTKSLKAQIRTVRGPGKVSKPSGFGGGGIPKGFKRPGVPASRNTPPDRVAPGWR
jgi:hypothetical protein